MNIFYAAFAFALVTALSACSWLGGDKGPEQYPQGEYIERHEERGSLTGDSGLFSFGGSSDTETNANAASPLGVNGYLWRATLDTLSFLPLHSADPFGGTIISDWYEDPKAPGERYKVNAIILGRSLRADGIKVTVFKQALEGGTWRDKPLDERLSRKLEDTILTRARELRIAQIGH